MDIYYSDKYLIQSITWRDENSKFQKMSVHYHSEDLDILEIEETFNIKFTMSDTVDILIDVGEPNLYLKLFKLAT